MDTKEAQISLKKLLNQLDHKSEVAPFHNFKKLLQLLELLKGIPLNTEEKLVAKKMLITG